MTIYQKELLRQLSKLNCTGEFDEETGMLRISSDGNLLCIAGKKGDLYWDQDKLITEKCKIAIDEICNAAHFIREYVCFYETALQLGVDSLPEYRRLAEYGNFVLGAMYSEQYGFMFSTWQRSSDKKYVAHGDYSSDFEYAKESFISRSGLINKNRVFTPEESKNLYRCLDYVRGNCETLTYDQEQQLKDLMEKLTCGYPQYKNDPPSFEQNNAPQLNML